MANLTTTDKQLIVNEGASIPRLQFSHRKHGENEVKITGNNGETITLDYRMDTIDDESYDSQQELFDAISSFLIDGGSTGAGVQSVSGDVVDDSDPQNPVINFPVNNVVSSEPNLQIESRGTYTFTGDSADWELPLISSTVGHTVRIVDWGSTLFTINGHPEDTDAISESGVNMQSRTLSKGETATFYNNSIKWVMT